jgi:GNAT superfamily N-acetyltransferase
LAWWVAPEHRGGTAGIKLLKRLESAAKEKGCVYWSMAFMETSMPSVVKKMYEKLNYELKETSYGKRL